MGIEGMVGIQYWLGVPSTPTQTIVQIAGSGHRMSIRDFPSWGVVTLSLDTIKQGTASAGSGLV